VNKVSAIRVKINEPYMESQLRAALLAVVSECEAKERLSRCATNGKYAVGILDTARGTLSTIARELGVEDD